MYSGEIRSQGDVLLEAVSPRRLFSVFSHLARVVGSVRAIIAPNIWPSIAVLVCHGINIL